MERSRRARRMERHHRRNRRRVPLNLVSLMDIFTILVFFLLVNSSDVEVLPKARAISLPESTADASPHSTVVVVVSPGAVLVDGRRVSLVPKTGPDGRVVMPGLGQVLGETVRRQAGPDAAARPAAGRAEVTIMADRRVPYRRIKRVMQACAGAGYGRVSLAVLQKAEAGR